MSTMNETYDIKARTRDNSVSINNNEISNPMVISTKITKCPRIIFGCWLWLVHIYRVFHLADPSVVFFCLCLKCENALLYLNLLRLRLNLLRLQLRIFYLEIGLGLRVFIHNLVLFYRNNNDGNEPPNRVVG